MTSLGAARGGNPATGGLKAPFRTNAARPWATSLVATRRAGLSAHLLELSGSVLTPSLASSSHLLQTLLSLSSQNLAVVHHCASLYYADVGGFLHSSILMEKKYIGETFTIVH